MAGPYSAGSIFLQIVPSFRGVPEAIAAEAKGWQKVVDQAGTDGGKGYSKNFEKEIGKGIPDAVSKAHKDTERTSGEAGTKAGKSYAGKFESTVKQMTERLNREWVSISGKIDMNDAEAVAKMRAVERNLAVLNNAKAEIGMDIKAGTTLAVLDKIQHDLAEIQRSGATVDLRVNAAALHEGVDKARIELERLATMTVEPEIKVRQSGAFERSIKDAVNAAIKDLPEIDLHANGSAADQEIARIRGELETLADQTIGVDITDTEAVRKIADLSGRLQQLTSERWGAQVDADTMAAAQKLDRILGTLEEVTTKHAVANVDADTARADAELQATLAFVRELDGKTARVSVNVDGAAKAAAELEAVSRASHSSAVGAQDGANAFRAFNGWLLAGATIGPTIVPALATAGAAAAAMGPLAMAGAAGIGVLVMSMSGVGAAVKAMGAAQKSAVSDQITYQKGVSSASNAMISASEGVDNARRNAARTAEDSARSVATAVLGEQRAREQAAQSAETAARSVRDADQGVERAEQSLQRAQEAAKRAQDDLTQAREDAVKSERDLQFQIEGGALAYQNAILDVADAEAKLAKVRANPKSTPEDIQRATLALAEQKLQVRELSAQNGDLAAKQADWVKGGVNGSSQVVAAQDRVKAANQSVADGQLALRDAQDKAAQARQQQALDAINASRNIAQAQQAVATAREQQDRSAADSQRSIADAQRALAQTQMNYQDALAKTSASQRNLNDAMSQLGPAGQDFAKYVYSFLIPAFHQLRDVAAQGFLPGFQAWITTIVGHYGPQLIQITGAMSSAMGGMFQEFSQALLSKPFADLFDMLQHDGPSFIGMMSAVLTNLGTGTASLIVALKPLAYLFGGWLVSATRAFSNWAANLGGSTGLAKFLGYVREVAPMVGQFFVNLAKAVLNLAEGLAPYATVLLGIFNNILHFIAGMDPDQLGRIAIAMVGVVAAIQGLFAFTAAAKSIQSALTLADVATQKFGVSIGSLFGGIGLIVSGSLALYQTSATFRDIVNGIASAIGDVVGWIQEMAPWLGNLVGLLATVGGSFMVFKGISSIFGGMAKAAQDLGPKLGVVVANMTGSESAGMRAMGVVGKLSGAFSMLGAALPLIGIGIGLVTAYFDAQQKKVDDLAKGFVGYYEAMGGGGAKAQEASDKLVALGQHMADLKRQIDAVGTDAGTVMAQTNPMTGQLTAYGEKVSGTKDELEKLVAAQKQAQKQWDEELAKMGPVERAQALMNVAIATTGANSDETRAKTDLYRAAVDMQRIAQDNAAFAIDGVNNALIRQNDILIAGAQSELAYQQSVDNLTDAHKRTKEALDKYGAGSDEYRRALLAEQVQSLQTAQAAAEHEKTLHQNSSTAVQNSLSQAALYLELKRQKEIYGELSPAQEQMLQNMSKTVSAADIAKVQFDNLGLAIVGVPNDKTITVASTTPEVEKQLSALGVHVQHMPDGTVNLTGNTKAAEDLLNFTARDRKSTVYQDVQWTHKDAVAYNKSQDMYGLPFMPVPPAKATGGLLSGPGTGTSDSILARVSNGEYVVRAAAVEHYGPNFLDMINAKAFATGGLVGRDGIPAFAGGGLVANWGGTIDLTGGNVSPLAEIWASAIRDITGLSGVAAQSVGKSFAAMRDGALTATGQLYSGVAGQWGQIAGVVNVGATSAQQAATGQFRVLQANANGTFQALNASLTGSWGSTVSVLNGGSGALQAGTTGQLQVLQANANGIFGQMQVALPASWNSMGNQLNTKTVDTQVRQVGWFTGLRDSLTTLTGQTRDNVTGAWNTMGTNVNWRTGDTSRIVQASWSGMGANLGRNTRDTVNAMARAFAGIQPAVQNPVNFVVNTVLNKGLYPAFNAVSSAVSLPSVVQAVAYHPATTNNAPIYAAAGGAVPGWSPHDKADNIPAWLTAGEFVQPVSTVDHYGVDIMDAIRHKRIPKEALAQLRYADGGYIGPRQPYAAGGFTWPELDSIRKRMFPGSVLTSAYRPGAHDYHGMGQAIDIGVPGNLQSGLMPIAAALARAFPNSTELIHNPNGSIKNGTPVSPGFWGGPTWAAHANHVHWAMTAAALAGAPGGGVAGSIFAPMLGGKWSSADAVHQYLANSFAGANAHVGGSPFGNRLHGVGPKDLERGWNGGIGRAVQNWFANAAASGTADPGAIANGPARDMTQQVFGQYGWGSGAPWAATDWIVRKESGWNPGAQNPISSASGLFQQIDSTWRANRPASAAAFPHMRNAPVPLQAAAGAAYIRSRFGTPQAAQAYWAAHGNYADGGLIVPELHDAGLGGVIHPGLNMIVNKTRKAEASVSMETIDNLRTIAEGGQVPLIGSVHLPIMPTATPDEIAGAILHQATVAKRGGKY